MLTNQLLDPIPVWALFILTVLVMLLAIEAGYRLSQGIRRKAPDKTDVGLGAIVGASLGLLAFLLAFTVSFAANVNNQRRRLVVAEANAISTLYNRAGYVDEIFQTEARDLLREYTRLRLDAMDPDLREVAVIRTEEIHNKLWASAEKIAVEGPVPANTLYISALGQVIDMHAERVAAYIDSRVPVTLFLGLYIVAWLTMFLVGVQSGEGERRNFVAQFVLVLILSVVFLLIIVLDRAREGSVWIPTSVLLDLQRQLNIGQ